MIRQKHPTNAPVVAASLLSAQLGSLEAEITKLSQAGADWFHIDVMDGRFVPPITFGANVVELVRRTVSLPIDVHLMTEVPENKILEFKDAGASLITVHQEVSPHLHRVLESIKAFGIKAGVAINPATPVQSVFEVLDLVDLVLVMTVNPGWGGQKFISPCLSKIETLKAEIERRDVDVLIEVDGGINSETAKKCRAAGADVLVSGSFLVSHEDPVKAVELLKSQ